MSIKVEKKHIEHQIGEIRKDFSTTLNNQTTKHAEQRNNIKSYKGEISCQT